MSERVVEVQGLEKTYVRGAHKVKVLAGLDLSVDAGEFVALMGPSGSGKSTLLNVVAGIDRPTAGKVWVAGSLLNDLDETQLAEWRARHVGFIFQFYNLIPVLSALENVELPLLLTTLSRKERRKRSHFALEMVGLADRADHRPSELSGGQEQRVAIARAIVSEPTLLVADEPTGDLDASSATAILELLGRLNEEHKKTILMVTHDPHAAEKAKKTIRLEKGVLAGTEAD